MRVKYPLEINECFQCWKWNTLSLITPYFSHVFSALKVKHSQPYFAIFFACFFINSENTTKFKFRQKTLNILSVLKFVGSHLVFYEWKVSFSLISPIIFSLGYYDFQICLISMRVSRFFIPKNVFDFFKGSFALNQQVKKNIQN